MTTYSKRLDKSRPYGQHCPPENGAFFNQDGFDFDHEGRIVEKLLSADQKKQLEKKPPAPAATSPAPAPPAPTGGTIDLNAVSFEQLRAENLSVTQATRLLAHRERLGGFQSVDDLDQVAGFPEDLLADLKSRSTV